MTEKRTEVQLLKVEEAAKRLGLSTSHLYRLTETGRMPCVRLGRAVRVSVDQLAAYIRLREDGGVKPPRAVRR